MVNYIYRVIEVYQRLSRGEELGEEEVWEASKLLGTPTRKVDALLSRYTDVLGRVIEERCSGVSNVRVCIYTWSRWAFKRYFPAALDAGGTIIAFEDDRLSLVSYPLHRAFDTDVRGVSVPEGDPIITPRIDGWQVNLYWDPILDRPLYSTRYVLHNMAYEGKTLKVQDYGVIINPIVKVADYLSEKSGLYDSITDLEGWTLTLMIKSEKPATALRRPPRPWDDEAAKLILIAAREPNGILLGLDDLSRLASKLGIESLHQLSLKGEDLEEWAEKQVDYPSVFLWFPDRGDREHPEIYEVKSLYYNDYIRVTHNTDAKSLVVILTSGVKDLMDRLRASLGESIINETTESLGELADSIKAVDPDKLSIVLESAGINRRLVKSAVRALREGRVERALRIIAVGSVEGFKVEDAPLILRHLARTLKE
ncbi:MAG: hypothetical protein GSR85_03205 [Desulfurococcales archaeon]|nr:hypothetical protein [Desulfurococcales archaeon]